MSDNGKALIIEAEDGDINIQEILNAINERIEYISTIENIQ
ncbi:MAG: hypothetical protein Q9M40_07800 [Sulfurimonas sp.]|nr:hypothetical protein [Sulfurimonas sp.]